MTVILNKTKHSNFFSKKLFLVLLCLFSLTVNLFAVTDFYWEKQKVISTNDSYFPRTLESKNKSYAFWQEVDRDKNQIWISCRVYDNFNKYEDKRRFAGPFIYSGEIPDIYSVEISDSGTVLIAITETTSGISIYSSDDGCNTFASNKIPTSNTMIAPRIYYSSNKKFRLFASVMQDDTFQLLYTESKDGKTWSSFKRFNPGYQYRNPFYPVSVRTSNGDMIVFQAQYESSVINRFSYQLFVTTTRDGSSWSTPVMITDESSLLDSDEKNFAEYQNQRPSLIRFKDKNYLAWERTDVINSSIWVTEITSKGIVPKTITRLTERGSASRALLFEYDDNLYVEWFDNRSGKDCVYLAQMIGFDWEESILIENAYDNTFPTPLFIKDDYNKRRFSMINLRSSATSSVVNLLIPDAVVDLPVITSSTYRIGNASNELNVTYQINFPSDTSGITGYSYSWGKVDSEVQVEEPSFEIQNSVRDRTINVKALENGEYQLKVRLFDKAGNKSPVKIVEYKLDLIPPSPPELHQVLVDDYGFTNQNDLVFEWNSSPDSDVEGYTYNLEYLGSIPKSMIVNDTHQITQTPEEVLSEVKKLNQKYEERLSKNERLVQSVITNQNSSKKFLNKENGIYKFTVAAIDQVGNISEQKSILVVLNKYKPQTVVSSAYQKVNKVGDIELNVNGGGFTYEGTIDTVIIDKDGKTPFDLVLEKSKGDFKVKSDNQITNIKVSNNLPEGRYKIILHHTDRGNFITNDIITIRKNGIIKIESEYEELPKYKPVISDYKFEIFAGTIILTLILLLIFVVLLFMIYVCIKAKKENKLIITEIKALLTGEVMPLLRKTKNKANKKSLRGKLIGFSVCLVIVVALFITLQNGYQMVNSQQKIMAEGLQNRIDVLLESLTSGVKNFMPTENDLEIGSLPSQKDAMTEVKYITILGEHKSDLEDANLSNKRIYVWASNDPDIESKVMNYGQDNIQPGETYITDELLLQIVDKYEGLNTTITDSVSDISKQIANFSAEITKLAANSDAESVRRRNEYSDTSSKLRAELNNKLSKIASENSNSLPVFTVNIFSAKQTDYLFYKPVLYRSGSTNNYFHGFVIAEVSIQNLIDELNSEVRSVIILAAITAFAAIILGILGAILMSRLIVKPIKRLESHLEKVGTIMTKSVRERQRLEKEHIEINTGDEIGRLGEVVNKMTLSAGNAAYEEFLQLDGKAVQERFIPLEDGKGGRKLPIVKLNEDKLDLFAFYKGDSAVSGDYFDYKKLDEQWYVFIKCDISGHGVPAALLVSVVATKFKDFYYFSNWNFKKNGIDIKKFVSAVNDFIFSLGTKGKFSTINISLYNKITGELYLCNAGDNKIHVLDGATKQLKEITLTNTPTAGGVSTDLVDMTAGGFKVEKLILNPGDVLYLYTDGIDEAERYVRDSDYEIKIINNEEQKEQFGYERIKEIIESVMSHKKFELIKKDNPSVSERLTFDFTKCSGSIDESILALASIERVFRMRKTEDIKVSDEIEIDTILDEFLAKYFSLYSKYCIPASITTANQNMSAEEIQRQKQLEDPNMSKYAYILEDKQADDITLIAIRRK